MKHTTCTRVATLAIIAIIAVTTCLSGCGGGGSSTGVGTADPTTTLTVPGAPTALVATAGDASISLAFTAPVLNGGST